MGLQLSCGFYEGKELWWVITPFFIFKCHVTSGFPALYFIVQIEIFDSNLLLFLEEKESLVVFPPSQWELSDCWQKGGFWHSLLV